MRLVVVVVASVVVAAIEFVADGFTWLVVVEVVVEVASVTILTCGYCGSDLLVVWLM